MNKTTIKILFTQEIFIKCSIFIITEKTFHILGPSDLAVWPELEENYAFKRRHITSGILLQHF